MGDTKREADRQEVAELTRKNRVLKENLPGGETRWDEQSGARGVEQGSN